MVDILPTYMWAYAAAGVITLAVAALAWRRGGGTTGVRAVAMLLLVPYTAFYLLDGLLTPVLVGDYWAVSWYPYMVLLLAGAGMLLYLAGAILILLAEGARHGRCSHGAENTGVAS